MHKIQLYIGVLVIFLAIKAGGSWSIYINDPYPRFLCKSIDLQIFPSHLEGLFASIGSFNFIFIKQCVWCVGTILERKINILAPFRETGYPIWETDKPQLGNWITHSGNRIPILEDRLGRLF